MATLTASMLLPSKLKPSLSDDQQSLFLSRCNSSRSPPPKRSYSLSPMMRLFGPAIFEASKLKVLFLGVEEQKHPAKLPRTYTLTHSDITSKLTLAISQTIDNSQLQGWYNKLQRDEVVAEWKKVKGKMSLHVHCHISGGHFLLDLFARLRYYIFCKELPVVLKAFVHGDENLFNNHPELQDAQVWVYFHSNIPEFNNVQCWGPLKDAVAPTFRDQSNAMATTMTTNQEGSVQGDDDDEEENSVTRDSIPEPCKEPCVCCFPPTSSIPWIHSLQTQNDDGSIQGLNQQQS